MGFDYNVTATFKPPINYIFTWHALSDACPKCQALNGREYQDQDLFQEVLWDHIWGNIWDLNTDQSLAHPHCRCQVEVRVITDWNASPELQELSMYLDMESLDVEVVDLTGIYEMRSAVQGLKTDLADISGNASEVNTAFRRYLILARQLGLPDNMTQAASAIQQFRMTSSMITHSAGMLTGGVLSALTGVAGMAAGGLFMIEQLRQLGTSMQEDIAKSIWRERQQALESLQMELRRQRY